jgi:hypothetical protein
MKARTRGISPEVKDRGGDPDLSQWQCEAETVQGPGALFIESAELAPLRNKPGVRSQAARLKPPASEPADRVKTSE